MSFIGNWLGAGKAADASVQGAQISADAQQKSLDYLKEREALPQAYREKALTGVGGLFGLDGAANQTDTINGLKNSAIYQQIMSGKAQGEDAILRNASVTGGLRSGNTSDALARYSGDLSNQAFTQSLNGLQGLAQLPSNANNIANAQNNIGMTQAQGFTGAAQAQQEGTATGVSTAIGIGSLIAAFSDARLKTNIKKIGKRGVHDWYEWDWNEEAAQFGLFGKDSGVMAHEAMQIQPEATYVKNGYLTVDYSKLAV